MSVSNRQAKSRFDSDLTGSEVILGAALESLGVQVPSQRKCSPPGAEQGRAKRGTNALGLSLVAPVLPRTFCWPNQGAGFDDLA
jgi:hypothetical protein